MKVIDLMQMYVNKEVLPKKIIIHDQVFDEDTIWEHKNNTFYCREKYGDTQFLFEYIVPEMLNDEVKIIEDTPKEDKKIEHLDLDELDDLLRVDLSYYNLFHKTHKMLIETKSKLNEIIDKINRGK